MYLSDSEIIRDVEVCAQMDILKVTVEFLAVTMLTILADRYLSNKTAIGVLIACVAFLCFIHRTWLIAQTRTAQENRIAVIAVCTILFAGMGALVGVILTHPSRKSLQAPNKTASKQEASPEPDSPQTHWHGCKRAPVWSPNLMILDLVKAPKQPRTGGKQMGWQCCL